MDIQNIILIILIFAVLYLMYKTRNVENFAVSDDINQAINDIYKADINAIRNLSNFATEIKNNNDSLTIPAKKTTTTDLIINGDITMNGNVNIVQFKGLIVIWSGSINNIPKGWAFCDGKKYKLDSTNTAVEDSTGTLTPDLRGRFILSSGQGTELTNRNIGDQGGEERHTLTVDEMPRHNHWFGRDLSGTGQPQTNGVDTDRPNLGSDDYRAETNYTGGSKSHENMPPFYVLSYIMKL